ncbi:MAG: DUF6614 family protein [Pseudomonadota bacterium]
MVVSARPGSFDRDRLVRKRAQHKGQAMPQLVNQFDLKSTVDRTKFDAAWHAFVDELVATDLATGATPMMQRQADSGFDTDDKRGHQLFSIIHFRDQAQADAAWAAIEDRVEPLGRLHRTVFAMVHNPVFTFWRAA